ncbi:MAG: hypothetical protein FWH20_01410 [Oscillospiraceae bacterium]|nr:hypothetical protein [Oscillospiraceae bacterium]
MSNRKRKHSFSILLSDEEYTLWLKKQGASGLSKTDCFVKLLSNSVIKMYSFGEKLKFTGLDKIRKT